LREFFAVTAGNLTMKFMPVGTLASSGSLLKRRLSFEAAAPIEAAAFYEAAALF
jgi:hypothetical protein